MIKLEHLVVKEILSNCSAKTNRDLGALWINEFILILEKKI